MEASIAYTYEAYNIKWIPKKSLFLRFIFVKNCLFVCQLDIVSNIKQIKSKKKSYFFSFYVMLAQVKMS